MRSLVWWGVLALAAVLCAGLQLDRQARRDGSYAELVPAPFRNFAQVLLANRALASGTAEQALRETRLLLARSPIPAEHVTLFALAAASSGDAARAEPALLASAGRGWREPLAQLFVADAALRAGEPQIAAERALGAFMLGQRNAELTALFERLSGTPAGQEALAQWIARNPEPGMNYAGWAIGEVSANGHAAVLAHVAEADGTAFDCARSGEFARRYLPEGQACCIAHDMAGRWRDCAVRRRRSPARRRRPAEAKSGELRCRRRSRIRQWQAGLWPDRRTYFGAGAGGYRIAYEGAGSASVPLQLRLICIDEAKRYRRRGNVRLEGAGASLAVPADGCGAQLLQLLAPRGKGSVTDLRLELAGGVG
ncbi:MAG: hypothetical protein R3D89_10170 [Sphingomonadaceae bacterium]